MAVAHSYCYQLLVTLVCLYVLKFHFWDHTSQTGPNSHYYTRWFKPVTEELLMASFVMPFSSLVHMYKSLSNKMSVLLKIAELEIGLVCMKTERVFVIYC